MRIGVLGGGQLARMLALAGVPLGMRFTVLDPAPDACAGAVAAHLVGGWDDERSLAALAAASDVVTSEFESVPATAAEWLAREVPVRPPPRALAVASDRLLEKELFARLGIATARFAAVGSAADAERAAGELGAPALLKTRRLGYDGKGQAPVRAPDDAADAWRALGGAPALLEEVVRFGRELSIVATRGDDGDCAFHPLAENHHAGGILRVTRAPAPAADGLQAAAEELARAVLEDLGHVGTLAVELFERDGELVANEIAPRVHNSGHWTIDGAATSQFENHVRAVAGLPLGPAHALRASVMVNLIGDLPPLEELAALPGARIHLYGKVPRRGRKIGHVTVTAADMEGAWAAAAPVIAAVERATGSR